MQLWSDEIDAMRDEARQVVAAGMAAMAEKFQALGTPPTDRQARVQQGRDLMARTYDAVPEAEVREIAGVPCRVFRPDGPATAIYLHFHGGGMMLGAPEMNDAGNLELSRRHGMAVVSVDYRLAPEHPFPAGPDDGIAVTRWLLDNGGAEFGSERLLIGRRVRRRVHGRRGAPAHPRRARRDRSGGRGEPVPTASTTGAGRRASGGCARTKVPTCSPPRASSSSPSATCRVCPTRRAETPLISPAYADLRGLPPALLSVGTCDHLLDDTLMLASRWAAVNGNAELFVAPDLPHEFPALPLRHHDRVVDAHERMDRRAVVTGPC